MENEKDTRKFVSITQVIEEHLKQQENKKGWYFTGIFPIIDTAKSEEPVTEDAEFEIIQPKQLKHNE